MALAGAIDSNSRGVPAVYVPGLSQLVPMWAGALATDPNNGNQQYAVLGHLLRDPFNAVAIATIAQFHNADNQILPATAYGLLAGGVAQLLNIAGNLDRQRETGVDSIPAQGVSTGSAQFAQFFLTTDSTDNFAAGTRTFTPVAMSGTINGAVWSIQSGSVLILDSGASTENVLVTGTTATTFTCVTTKTHNGTGTAFLITGFVYNQERDAAGELDGASGRGTAIAAEYEYNGGAPDGNYDRERNVNGKGVNTQTISAGGGAGSAVLTLSAAAVGLLPGQPIYVTGGTAERARVREDFVVGSTTVPLSTPLVNGSHTGITYDVYTLNGAGANGMTPFGLGIDALASFDKNAPAGQQYFTAQGILGAVAVQQGGLATGTAAAATAVAIKASRGICCTVTVTVAGTAAVNIYDNASSASGTVILAIPASAPVGSVYTINMPCANGIFVGGVTSSPALTISYV